MAKHLCWMVALGAITLLLFTLLVGGALAIAPDEFLYGTSQASNLTITNPANSVDGAFNDAVATVRGSFGDGPANNWTFTAVQDTAASAIAGVSAEIRFSQTGWVDDTFAFEVYDGAIWTRVATYNTATPPPSALMTLSYDVSAILNTVAKVNAAQLRLIGVSKTGARDTITLAVDEVRLGVQWGVPATPTATSTATPTPTSTPTPTAAPSGTTGIAPNNAQTALPGATVAYTHTVTQLGQSFDYKNITASSSAGWTLGLYGADGLTPLADNNGDGIPDSGRLNSGQSATIVVKVAVPAGAAAGAQDVTTVTAVSARNPTPGNTASATDTTTVGGTITLSLSSSTVDYGQFSPGGNIDPAVSGVSSSPDGLGAYYVKQGTDNLGAVKVTVSSNGAWSGSCWASENAGSASTIRVGDGLFQWSLAGAGGWTALTSATQVPPYDNSCFASRPQGTATYGYDYRLRVRWIDDPGTFSSDITFAVSQ